MSKKKSSNSMNRVVLILAAGFLGILILFGTPFYFYLNYHLISKDTWISTQQKLDEQDKTIKEQAAKITEQEKAIKDQAAKPDTQDSTETIAPATNNSQKSQTTVQKTVESKPSITAQEEKKTSTVSRPKYSLENAYAEMGVSADASHTGQIKDLAKQLMNYRNQHPQSSYLVADALRDLGVPQNATPSLFILKRAIDLIESKK